jgi:hypothetical protein
LKPNFSSVKITSVPPGAHVWLDGKSKGETPLELAQMEAGEHELKVSYPDHRDGVRKFRVKPGKPVALKITLQPAFGHLVIKSKPETEAKVFLDGDELGSTPLTLKRVLLGKHTIRVTKEMHRPFETEVNVESGKSTQVMARLSPAYGTLVVDSQPSGARVVVDDKKQGQTPVSLRLSPGLHHVEIGGANASRGRVEKKVSVRLGKRKQLKVKLPVKTGSLMVDTIPFAAEIELDGKNKGRAPLSLKDVTVGTHVIVARVKGKEPLTGRIEVVEGKTAVAEVNLEHPAKSIFRSGAATKASAGKKPVVASKPRAEPKPEPKKPDPGTEFEPMPAKKPEADHDKKGTAAKSGKGKKEVASGSPRKLNTETSTGTTSQAVEGPLTVSKSRPMSTWRLLAWISTGTAGAAAVTSVVLFSVGAVKQSDADDAWEHAADTSLPPERRDEWRQLSKDLDDEAAGMFTGGWVTGGFALAAAGAAVYFFLTEPEPSADGGAHAGLQLTPLPGGGWVGFGGRF